MSLTIRGALLTDPGRQRAVNEDWVGSIISEDDRSGAARRSVWAVADGVSGYGIHMAGELPGRGHVHFRHRLSPLRDETGDLVGYVLVLDDETERFRLERERRRADAERERV